MPYVYKFYDWYVLVDTTENFFIFSTSHFVTSLIVDMSIGFFGIMNDEIMEMASLYSFSDEILKEWGDSKLHLEKLAEFNDKRFDVIIGRNPITKNVFIVSKDGRGIGIGGDYSFYVYIDGFIFPLLASVTSTILRRLSVPLSMLSYSKVVEDAKNTILGESD